MSQSPHSRGTPSRVGDLISDSGNNSRKNLGAFYDHARVLSQLDSLLSGFAGPDLANRFQVANLRQDHLILITPSASFATRLKLQAPDFIEFLHASGVHQVHDIEIRVAPLQKPLAEPKARRQTSAAAQEAADLISQLTQKKR
jgi:hypothetical protein